MPTAAYPDSVQMTPEGQLVWVAGKGDGSGPNPSYYFGALSHASRDAPNAYGTYVLDLLIGREGDAADPIRLQVVADTAAGRRAGRALATVETQPAGSPIPGVTGQAKQSDQARLLYRAREPDYDRFGSDPRGDGSPQLELFDKNGVAGAKGGITPNAHALTQQFPLLDHGYEDSEVSVDGHPITSGGDASDYAQKATRGQLLQPPWNLRLRDRAGQRVASTSTSSIRPPSRTSSFRDYGGDGDHRHHERVQPDHPAASRPTSIRPTPTTCSSAACRPATRPACTQDSGEYNGTGTPFARAEPLQRVVSAIRGSGAAGTVPALNYMILPNDHTNGTTTNDSTPQAFIADNDLALGQMVDAISHSSIWPSTAIFVVEDDSQDGADHVDSHRTPMLVISPWARHGAVVHTRYDQYSVLRTVELILGMQPLALNDALATPMYDAFISGTGTPDNGSYSVQMPTYPLTSTNGVAAPLARLSNELPFNRLDAVPQAISDQIMWASVHGAKSTPPKAGPDASPQEVDRAAIVRGMLRRDPSIFQVPVRSARTAGSGQARIATCPITWACRPAPPATAEFTGRDGSPVDRPGTIGGMEIDPDDLETTLAVLARLDALPVDHPDAVAVRHATARVFKSVKERRRADRRAAVAAADRAVMARTATAAPDRIDDETNGQPLLSSAAGDRAGTLQRAAPVLPVQGPLHAGGRLLSPAMSRLCAPEPRAS